MHGITLNVPQFFREKFDNLTPVLREDGCTYMLQVTGRAEEKESVWRYGLSLQNFNSQVSNFPKTTIFRPNDRNTAVATVECRDNSFLTYLKVYSSHLNWEA